MVKLRHFRLQPFFRMPDTPFYLLLIIFIIYIPGCGEDFQSFGSLEFAVSWPETQKQVSSERLLNGNLIDCEAIGEVKAQVYDASHTILAEGGPWDCSAHEGAIRNVLAGENRTIVISARDPNNRVLYWGERTGITVQAGQNNDVGIIDVHLNPLVTIISPVNNHTYIDGNSILFYGAGVDFIEGALGGDSLVWTSDKDGQIGTGPAFTKDDLTIGTHTITLTVTNSISMENSVSIDVTIEPRPFLAYIAAESSVKVINCSTRLLEKTIQGVSQPMGVVAVPNGEYVYVTDYYGGKVIKIDTGTNTIIKSMDVRDGAYGLDVSPDGNYVYVSRHSH